MNDPHQALPLLKHLLTYGEATPQELADLHGAVWSGILQDCGMAHTTENGSLLATLPLLSLPPDLSETHLLRAVCFCYPPYRRRLLTILINGLLTAAQRDMLDEVERWAIEDLSTLTPEMNTILDDLEAGERRLVDLPEKALRIRFEVFFATQGDFSIWDHALFGLSGAPMDLFSAVVDKFGKAHPGLSGSHAENMYQVHYNESQMDSHLALLPELLLVDPESGRLAELIPTAWTTIRTHYYSSLPLFDAAGKPLYDPGQPKLNAWQDALAQQPFYRAVIHLAFAHRLGIGEPDQVVLRFPGRLAETHIEIGGQPVGSTSECLAILVAAMGFRPILPTSLVVERLVNLLENLLAVRVLTLDEDRLVLEEIYALSLSVAPRAQRLARGRGKGERDAILKALTKQFENKTLSEYGK